MEAEEELEKGRKIWRKGKCGGKGRKVEKNDGMVIMFEMRNL